MPRRLGFLVSRPPAVLAGAAGAALSLGRAAAAGTGTREREDGARSRTQKRALDFLGLAVEPPSPVVPAA